MDRNIGDIIEANERTREAPVVANLQSVTSNLLEKIMINFDSFSIQNLKKQKFT